MRTPRRPPPEEEAGGWLGAGALGRGLQPWPDALMVANGVCPEERFLLAQGRLKDHNFGMDTLPQHQAVERKPETSIFDDVEAFTALVTATFAKAVKAAVAEAHRQGVTTYGTVDGKIIACVPGADGTVQIITPE